MSMSPAKTKAKKLVQALSAALAIAQELANLPDEERPARAAPAPKHIVPTTPEHFAALVREAANAPQVHRFGSKAFLGSVWEYLSPQLSLSREQFNDYLVQCHQRGLLRLSRADLTSAMDPRDVKASELRFLNATFHFVDC